MFALPVGTSNTLATRLRNATIFSSNEQIRIRNLRWEGGVYQSQASTGATLTPEDFQKNFDDAIKKSLEEEKLKQK